MAAVVPVVPVVPDPVPEVPLPDPVPEPDPELESLEDLLGKVTETLTVDVLPLAVVPETVFDAAPPVALPPVAAPPVAEPPLADPPAPPAPPLAVDVDVDAEVGDTGVELFASATTGTVNIEATRIPRSLCFMASPLFFCMFQERGKVLFPSSPSLYAKNFIKLEVTRGCSCSCAATVTAVTADCWTALCASPNC